MKNYYFIQSCCGPCALETEDPAFPLGAAIVTLSQQMDHMPRIYYWRQLTKKQFKDFMSAVAYLKAPPGSQKKEPGNAVVIQIGEHRAHVKKPSTDPTQGA